jgi:hypothetical protein
LLGIGQTMHLHLFPCGTKICLTFLCCYQQKPYYLVRGSILETTQQAMLILEAAPSLHNSYLSLLLPFSKSTFCLVTNFRMTCLKTLQVHAITSSTCCLYHPTGTQEPIGVHLHPSRYDTFSAMRLEPTNIYSHRMLIISPQRLPILNYLCY